MTIDRLFESAYLLQPDGVEMAGVRASIQIATDRAGGVTWRGTVWPLTERDANAIARFNDRGTYILRLPSGKEGTMFITDRHSQSQMTDSGHRTMIVNRASVSGSGDCPVDL
jgi:hypothetical protein